MEVAERLDYLSSNICVTVLGFKSTVTYWFKDHNISVLCCILHLFITTESMDVRKWRFVFQVCVGFDVRNSRTLDLNSLCDTVFSFIAYCNCDTVFSFIA